MPLLPQPKLTEAAQREERSQALAQKREVTFCTASCKASGQMFYLKSQGLGRADTGIIRPTSQGYRES